MYKRQLYSCSSENEDPVPPVQEGTENDEKEKYTYVYQLKADNYNMPVSYTHLVRFLLFQRKDLIIWKVMMIWLIQEIHMMNV